MNCSLSQKSISESITTQVHLVMHQHLNSYNRLFGGKLMQWIDVVAAVVAIRHSGRNVTTVCIDNLQFKAGAYVGELIVLQGKITYVGNTSMEVRVDTFIEDLNGIKRSINQAYLTLVALDEDDHPTPVPALLLHTDEEKEEWEAGLRRNKLRQQRRQQFY